MSTDVSLVLIFLGLFICLHTQMLFVFLLALHGKHRSVRRWVTVAWAASSVLELGPVSSPLLHTRHCQLQPEGQEL